VKVWPDPVIRKVLLPWLAQHLDVPQLPLTEDKLKN
jgi:hypothetical protein